MALTTGTVRGGSALAALFGFFLHTLFTTTMSTNREVAETQDNGKSHGPRTTHLRYAFRKAAIILSCFRNGRAFQ